MKDLLKKITNNFDKESVIKILRLRDEDKIKQLFSYAYEKKKNEVGQNVYLRGLIEISNICSKNCYYCGIRRENSAVNRFEYRKEQILETALLAYEKKYGSIVLQAGERKDKTFINLITETLLEIKKRTNGELGITLSLGEQSEETYKKWFDAGATRYLLRIETSNEDLYKKLHPADHLFSERMKALETLKKIGYQTGTGFLINPPYQTYEDMANDLLFLKQFDIDMIGMGPYIIHKETPLYKIAKHSYNPKENFLLGLKMIALARIILKDVNIASTTALQTLDIKGREKGILAGANVIMPSLTAKEYKKDYNLYEKKWEKDINDLEMELLKNLQRMGEVIRFGQKGDPIHYVKRIKKLSENR